MEHSGKSESPTSAGHDMFGSQWRQMRGTLRSWWGKLSDNDWERIAGQKDKLLGILQEKYGYTRDRAQQEMERRFGEYSRQSSSSSSSSESMAESQRHRAGVFGHSTTSPEQTAQQALHSASQLSSTAQSYAQDLKQNTTAGIDQAKTAVGQKMNAFADTLRRQAGQQGSMESPTHAVANRLATAGSYLEEHTFEDMTADMTRLIRRYPVQALLLGLGIGFLISRGMER